MNQQKSIRFVPGGVIVAIIILSSCRSTDLPEERELYYMQHEPLSQVEKLEPTIQSVNRILISAHYDLYSFDEDEEMRLEYVQDDPSILDDAESYFDIETVGGSAIFLDISDGYPLIMTANHVIRQPDSVAYYYEDQFGEQSSLAQLRVQDRVDRYLPHFRELGSLKVLVSDEERDVALLTSENPFSLDEEVEYLPVELGNPELLDWGSKVFAFGYPLGNEMLSTATVSEPNRDEEGGFLIDALFNPGFSGGAILAVNNETYALELVGMARSASANSQYYLRPERSAQSPMNVGYMYEGPNYLEREQRINYGIVRSVSSNAIRDLLREHADTLEEAGFDLELD